MARPPRPPGEGIFSRSVNYLLGVISIYLTVILIPLFAYYYYWNPWGIADPDQVLTQAQTMVFVTLIMAEQVNAFNCRSDYHSLFTVGFFANRFLVVSVILSTSMMLAVIYWPPLSDLFHTTPLRWQDWGVAVGLSVTLIPVVELTKWIIRRRTRSRRQTATAT
jgi:Ca2+-transporting ATPase